MKKLLRSTFGTLVVDVATSLSELRAAAGVMQGADITERAAVAGEAGEVTTEIRTTDIPAIV